MNWGLRFSDHVPRIALFVTEQAHCLHDLLGRAVGQHVRGGVLVYANKPVVFD